LHLAAVRGDLAAVKLLIRYGATIDIRTKNGITPLYFACLYGNYSVASALLRAGADPNKGDDFGRCPIHGASSARRKPTEIISLLLQHGANI
ncbi:ankyrin repeat-containing domain protein, partial [Immersiella caudata]